MSGKTLKIDLRRERILEALSRDDRVSASRLSAELGVTPVTIRNDLAALAREGRLHRVRGGALPATQGPGFGDQAAEKQEIGRALARRVRPGDRLFINSGTTSRAVAGELARIDNLHVVTNAPGVARMLAGRARVVLLGGNISPAGDFTYGEDALNQLARYQADWAILSVDSISAAEGVSICHPEESEVSRRMLERSVRGVIAADHTKLGRAGFVRICPAVAPLMLSTGPGADPGEIAALRDAGVEILST